MSHNPEVMVELIFVPGFSSKTEADDISGLGVGKYAVKSLQTSVGSSMDIIPEVAAGTFILRFHSLSCCLLDR